MNENNLDDLIVQEPSAISKKSKSAVIVIALAVIVLLLGILLSRMILDDSDDINITDTNHTQFVSPDVIPPSSETEPTNGLTPIIDDTIPEPTPEPIENIEPAKTKPKPVTQKLKPTPIKPKPAVAQTKPKPKPKPAKTTRAKPAKKPIKVSNLFDSGKPLYFVQVGAFNKQPNAKFLNKIKNAGLEYVININEKTRRVRVGPYSSYTDAKQALGTISDAIGVQGFVVKQK